MIPSSLLLLNKQRSHARTRKDHGLGECASTGACKQRHGLTGVSLGATASPIPSLMCDLGMRHFSDRGSDSGCTEVIASVDLAEVAEFTGIKRSKGLQWRLSALLRKGLGGRCVSLKQSGNSLAL